MHFSYVSTAKTFETQCTVYKYVTQW